MLLQLLRWGSRRESEFRIEDQDFHFGSATDQWSTLGKLQPLRASVLPSVKDNTWPAYLVQLLSFFLSLHSQASRKIEVTILISSPLTLT